MAKKDTFEYSGVLKNSIYTTLQPFAASKTTTEVVDKKATPTAVKLKTPDTQTVKEIKFANWGVNNNEPNLIIAEIEAVPTASRALAKRVESTYGLGPFFYQLVFEEGKELIKPFDYAANKEFKTFIKKIRLPRYCTETLMDAEGLGNVFPEFIVNNEFDKLISLRHNEAKHCRFSVMEDGVIKYCGISSEWGTDETVNNDNCTVVMVADPFLTVNELKEWLKKNKIKKFIFPVSIPSLGQKYYEKPTHDSSRKAGWTEIAKLIPSAILATLKNAKRIQWHIKIPEGYWKTHFPDANYATPLLRKAAMQAKLDEVDDFLSGADNAGKSFYSPYESNPISGKEMGGWIIEKLDGSIKFEKDILTTTTANSEIAIAWGVDPSIIGMNQLGQNNGSGSGSDKREADMIMKGNKLVADLISEPIEFAIEFNGWGDDIKMGFKKEILTTLDKNPTGSQKAGV